MPNWLSPFPIHSAIEEDLRQLGWTRWLGELDAFPEQGAWLYDTPDQLLARLQQGPAAMHSGYRQLLALPVGTRFLAIHRLLPEPAGDPLALALAHQLITQQAGLLDAYLDLELRADLLGDQPDTTYARRLQRQLDPEAACEAWQALQGASLEAEQQLADLRDREREAREEAELMLLQLHQVQEELEQVFLADREKQQKLAQLDEEIQALASVRVELEEVRDREREAREEAELTLLQLHQVQEELEQVFLADREKQQKLTQLDEEIQALASVRVELEEVRDREREEQEEAELTLLQLHQVQEELEHYFLLSRGQGQQLNRYGELQRRSQRLLAQLSRLQPAQA